MVAGPQTASAGLRSRDDPTLAALADRVRQAAARGTPLSIAGGGTKAFYGRACGGEPLSIAAHAGIVAYEPTELVVTARAGTRLAELDAALAEHDQMLGFEPPRFGNAATLGGAIATGLSGPARPWLGAARDFVLGLDLMTGRGEVLRFGGQVMKNVAGFDVSRLVTGALGTLGIVTRVSLRVLPRPRAETTLRFALPRAEAHARMLQLARRPWPITAMAYDGKLLQVRVAGSDEAVRDAERRLAPDSQSEDEALWVRLREAEWPAGDGASLWRLALPPSAPDFDAGIDGRDGGVIDWGGAQRWMAGDFDREALDGHCVRHGGHATLFRAGTAVTPGEEVFTQPEAPLRSVLERVKHAFDPDRVLNPGRLYSWL